MSTADNVTLCSECFNDEGLKLEAGRIGAKKQGECPNCGSASGKKLSTDLIWDLAHRFFVRGTTLKTPFGGAPVVQFNEDQTTSIIVADWLKNDVRLIEKAIKVGFFLYGPPLWRLGETEPLNALQSIDEREETICRILERFPARVLSRGETFYRLRKGPRVPSDIYEYDSPPVGVNGRFAIDVPVLYGSQDLEVCVHECRVTVEDELYVGTLYTLRELKLFDLTASIEESGTEYERLGLAVHMLFFAGEHSYEITRQIALGIKRAGFDGIIYPSYFSTFRALELPNAERDYEGARIIQNIALFGRPIQEQKVAVKCVNRVVLNKVVYDLQFGPVTQ